MLRRCAVPLLAVLLLQAAAVYAEERAHLSGRVFSRGSTSPIPGAFVQAASGESAIADGQGRFELDLPAGTVKLSVGADRHETLQVKEQLLPGARRTVSYDLLPLPAYRQRFTARVRGESLNQGGRFSFEPDELRTLAGSLGDPVRAVGLLPGVSAPIPVLPLWVVRGASPGTTGFFVDGLRVPQLYHLLVGGSVIHPRLFDRVDFFPGAYDASFGHFAGGIIDAETHGARGVGQHGEIELRLYEVGAALELNLPKDVHVSLSGRYGFPGALIRLFVPDIDVQYWDYQARVDWHGLTVEALGAHDAVVLPASATGTAPQSPDQAVPQTVQTFHRVQIRDRLSRGPLEVEAALYGGYDQLHILTGSGVHKESLGFRLNTALRWKHIRFYAGLDGEVSRFSGEFDDQISQMAPDWLGDLTGGRTGIEAGAFAEWSADLIPSVLTATVGARMDVYNSAGITLLGLDPRAQVRLRPLPWLQLSAAGGQYQQPPSFPIALPGIDTFALQLGLQRAIHSEVSLETFLPKSFEFSVKGYYQKYYNTNDFTLNDFSINLNPTNLSSQSDAVTFATPFCTSPPNESLTGIAAQVTRQLDGEAYGMELLLRRRKGRVTGWIAYTLSRSERVFSPQSQSCGIRPSDFDQTHVLNVVLQVRLPWNLVAGAHLQVATGRPVTIAQTPDGRSTIRNNARLPTYVQLDLRLDREWIFRRWALAAFLEVVNATFSQTILGVTYPEVAGVRQYNMPDYSGFPYILPSLGLRGRF